MASVIKVGEIFRSFVEETKDHTKECALYNFNERLVDDPYKCICDEEAIKTKE